MKQIDRDVLQVMMFIFILTLLALMVQLIGDVAALRGAR